MANLPEYAARNSTTRLETVEDQRELMTNQFLLCVWLCARAGTISQQTRELERPANSIAPSAPPLHPSDLYYGRDLPQRLLSVGVELSGVMELVKMRAPYPPNLSLFVDLFTFSFSLSEDYQVFGSSTFHNHMRNITLMN
jgi:hypothetical protein